MSTHTALEKSTRGRNSTRLCVGGILTVFLLSSYCLSVACDFSVMNEYCSYDRKNATKSSRNGVCPPGPGGKGIGQAQVWLRWWVLGQAWGRHTRIRGRQASRQERKGGIEEERGGGEKEGQ